ncbi:serine/arginine repetitive matrix protein 1-like [Mus caroli]|uniref:Serine/arginine repetitive matrix protein 1-like n=1 Tax=Mus caroli TaxID=10089 RepID=A0A6P5PDZ7_MUSCR|nr:serine/arginine repetitive matrix protein 1-like [Mus caroli]
MHELALLRGAGEAGTPQTDADDASRFARTRVPRRLRVALDWDRLPCSLPAPRLRTLCPQPGLPPPYPRGLQGLASEPDQWSAASSPLACSRASRPMAARRARRSLPRGPSPRPRPHATEDLGAPPPRWSAGCGRPAPAPRGFSAALVLINSQASVALRRWRGTGTSPSWPATDQPLHPSPPGLQRAQMLRWKPREQPSSPRARPGEACVDICQVSLPTQLPHLWG